MMKRKSIVTKKIRWFVPVLFILVYAGGAFAAMEALSPEDAKYLYPVKSITLDGHKVAYIDEGKGRPVIFIHGVSATLASFEGLYPAMVKNGYRVIGIDLLGYGKSDKPDILYSVPLHAKTVVGLARQLGLKDAILVGHSMGGAVSVCAMLEEPDLFRSMVLMTPGGLTQYSPAAVFFLKHFYDYVWAARYSDPRAAEEYYRELVYQWSPEMNAFLLTRQRMMAHPEWKKVQKTIRESTLSVVRIAKEILPEIGSIKKPVLVLLARNDNLINSEKVKANIEKRTKEWEIDVFEKCGHMIQLEQKDKVIARLLEFAAR
jgi:pimeloyl-ACP methyl ester carboxylesterase